jgi:hypothetical protein
LKGLRHEDPLSPILCNIMKDILTILLRGKRGCETKNLVPDLVDGGISIMQYDDDTIRFMKHDLAKVVNMNLILCFLNNYLV